MTQEHPITPPPELLIQWWDDTNQDFEAVATQAARWGADCELDACCEWFRVKGYHPEVYRDLRDARRPKPPSLKEQALTEIERWAEDKYGLHKGLEVGLIRRALEALPD